MIAEEAIEKQEQRNEKRGNMIREKTRQEKKKKELLCPESQVKVGLDTGEADLIRSLLRE